MDLRDRSRQRASLQQAASGECQIAVGAVPARVALIITEGPLNDSDLHCGRLRLALNYRAGPVSILEIDFLD